MSDAALIKAVLPRDTTKRLSRLMEIPPETARHWLYRTLAPSRRAELGRRLIAEFERQEADRALTLAMLRQMLR